MRARSHGAIQPSATSLTLSVSHTHTHSIHFRVSIFSHFTYVPDGEEDESRREQQREHIAKGRECERHVYFS